MSSPIKFIDNRQYHKSNYSDIMKYIIPSMYFEDDYALKDKKVDVIDQVINSHLNVIGNISSILYVSAVPGTVYSGIDTADGISKFFIKQNDLTNFDINDFERKILLPINKSFRDFNSSSEFSDFLLETLLPGTRLNSPTIDFLEGGAASANHNYLITNLSWLYFLNLSGPPSLTYNPSAYVHDTLISRIYAGQPVLANDGIKGLTNYLWKNYTTQSWSALGVIPASYVPNVTSVDATWTSGTQQLDKLLTLVDVVYSPSYLDDGDLRVKNAIEDYLQNSFLLSEKKLQGPFLKLLKAFSFSFADYSNYIDRLEALNDLNECPDEYLPLLADLIGWKLFGSEPDRWRLQLANAVDIYRYVGTKKAIQVVADSVFGEDVFDVSSKIYELWESYVPFLIQYALATGSEYLRGFDTWNRTLARDLGCEFSTSSMDENIRNCVDKIITDVVYKFPDNFILGTKPFELEKNSFIFNYRGKTHKVPPFEEIPYYTRVILNSEMIEMIEDKLICFGVDGALALAVGDYIRNKTILSTSDSELKNSWLIFTSGAEYPPNWNSVIQDISNNRAEYLPLWNGKSSYFKILFDTSSFDFGKSSLEADSKDILTILAQTIKQFSPAKAISDVIARTSAEDSYSAVDMTFPYVGLGRNDHGQIKYTSAAITAGFGMSALAMSTYKRGITTTAVGSFSRWDADSLIDSLVSPFGTTANLPRRNHRRRDFKFILPKEGFYDRTGFNTPNKLNNYIVTGSLSGTYFPLGLIPSSQHFVSIPNYSSIPEIYSKCEDLTSSSVYSGLTVSNTFPIRGLNSDTDILWDRGQLHPFVAVVHSINERAKVLQASAYYDTNLSAYSSESNYKDVLQSYANSATEVSGWFPNSFEDYVKYKFGRDFQKLYYDYTHNFNRHRAISITTELDGPTVFGHTFGSILTNSNFHQNGTLTAQYPQLIVSSLDNIFNFNVGSNGVFNTSAGASGTYVASSLNDVYVKSYDLRNSGILAYVEFSQTSGSSPQNYFTVFRLNKSDKRGARYNPIFHENTVIKQKSLDNLSRMIFEVNKYQHVSAAGFDVSTNFLTPNHKFKLRFKTMILDEGGRTLGGDSVGVWIHTKPENGNIWTYTKDNIWVQHSASGLEISDIVNTYSHNFGFLEVQRDLDPSKLRCARFLVPSNPNRANDLLASLSESEFSTVELTFNTDNLPISVPNDYFRDISTQVHRLNQNYVIEIFSNCKNPNKFTLFYDLDLVDQTLNTWSKPLITGLPNGSNMGEIYCKEYRVDISRDELLTIIRYFNDIAGAYSNFGYANRSASYTSGVYETSGGSRINYVESPYWNTYSVTGTGLLTDLTFNN